MKLNDCVKHGKTRTSEFKLFISAIKAYRDVYKRQPYAVLGYIPGTPLFHLVLGAILAVSMSVGLWLLIFCRTKRLRNAIAFIKHSRS